MIWICGTGSIHIRKFTWETSGEKSFPKGRREERRAWWLLPHPSLKPIMKLQTRNTLELGIWRVNYNGERFLDLTKKKVSFSTDIYITTPVSVSQFAAWNTERNWQRTFPTTTASKTYFGLAGRRRFFSAVQKNKKGYTMSMSKLPWKVNFIIN